MSLKHKQVKVYQNQINSKSNDLVLQYMPAVRAQAYRLKERLPSSVDVNDLISIATEEMIKLSRRYDESQNDNFWGYAKQRVYGSMLDYLRSLDTVSRANRKIIKQVEFESSKFYNKHGYDPDDEYLSSVIGEDIQKIKDAKIAAEVSIALPINEQISLFSERDVESKVEQDQLLDVVQNILCDLKQRDQMVIQLYYFEELSLKEISKILEITESRISQIHKKVIQKIRDKMSES